MVVGLDLATVGVVLSLAAALALPVGLAAGGLVDRFGARQVVIAGQVLQGVGFLAYLAVRDPWQLGLAAFLATAGLRMFWAAFFAFLADVAQPGQTDRWYGLASALQGAGFSVGGLVAGLLVQFSGTAGYRALVVANAVSFLLAAALVTRGPRGGQRSAPDQRTQRPGYAAVLRDSPFLALTGLNAMFATCALMLPVGIPIFARIALGAPAWLVGVLFTFSTLQIVTCQTIVVRLLERVRRTRALGLAGLLWCAWSLLTAAALAVPRAFVAVYLLAITVVQTVAEMIHQPSSNGLATAASPPAARGRYLAVFQLSWNTANLVAPAFFTLLFTRNPIAPWVVIAVAALFAAAGAVLLEGRLRY